jgi:hypothetical protein
MARKRSENLDFVDLIGEVRLADLDGRDFSLQLDDGTKIQGKFTPEQESIITEALREHSSRRLRVKGQAEFMAASGKIKRIVSLAEIAIQNVGDVPYDPSARPIWEEVMELGASIPDEEWAKVPTDLAKNLDHYLYGSPKEED